MFRSLTLQTPIQAGSWDDLLLYYIYQKDVRQSDLRAENDPMLKFKTPEQANLPNLSQGAWEIFDFSLGGFSGQAPLQPQPADFRQWVDSYTQSNYRNSLFDGVISEEPRVSVNLPLFFERERESTYRKIFRNSAIREYLNSIYVMAAAYLTRPDESFRLTDDRNFISAGPLGFLRAMVLEAREIGEPLGLTAEDILRIPNPDNMLIARGDDKLLTVLDPVITGFLLTDGADDNDPISLAGHALYRGLEQLLDIDQILNLIAGSSEYQNPTNNLQWSYYKTQLQTPFVKSAASRKYLSETQATEKRASLKANYNLYVGDYERATLVPGVKETYIPNSYAYYIVNTSVPDPETGEGRVTKDLISADMYPGVDENLRVPRRIREISNKTTAISEQVLTLDGESDPGLLYGSSDSVPAYYSDYASKLNNTVSETPEVTENIIFPSSDPELLEMVKNKEKAFPYSIGVEFSRDNKDNRSAEIIYTNLRSVGILSGISGSSPVPRPALINTENLINQNGRVAKGVVPAMTKDINFYNLPGVMNFSAPPESNIVKPIVFTQNCLEGATAEKAHPWLIPSQDPVLGEIMAYAASNFKKYSEVVDISNADNFNPEEHTVSDAIGYKLTKRSVFLSPENRFQEGPVIQNIMFGNTPDSALSQVSTESQIVEYIDTQVKYGQNYSYSLSEYRLVYSTEYEFFMVNEQVPSRLRGNTVDVIRAYFNNIQDNQIPVVNYRCYVLRRPKVELIEVPIYNRGFYAGAQDNGPSPYPVAGLGRLGPSFGLEYPPVRVLDTPPPPPDLTVLPLKGRTQQVKIVMTPSAGAYRGEHALPVVYIPHSGTFYRDATRPLDLWRHQQEYSEFPPQPQEVKGEKQKVLALNYVSEGVKEIKAIKIYRTTDLNMMAPSLARVYTSFDPVKFPESVNSLTLINTLYAPEIEPNQEEGQIGVVSYDLIDTIEPNVFYYYTCVAVDSHDNTSPPSQIYRVRLVLDKGLLIPEVDVYEHEPVSLTTSTRKFARFIQIQASPIQSYPFSERNEDGQLTSIRSLASEEGQSSVTDNRFIVRLTSKDTGRKFDIELTFDSQNTPLAAEEE